MQSPASSLFAFMTCQKGFEPHIKQAMLAAQPLWRGAFARPGFLTFKATAGVAAAVPRPTPLARAYGVALGRATEADGVHQVATQLAAQVGPLHLHAWQLDSAAVPLDGWVASWHRHPSLWTQTPLHLGAAVLDVIAVDATTVWVGWHRHAPDHAPFAGGTLAVQAPSAAPSRAYGKVREMLAYAGIRVAAGCTVLELGSAPGGSTLALLELGAHVIAVDPGALHTSLAAFAAARGCRLMHLRQPVAQLQRAAVHARGPVEWLFSDMNLAPPVVLAAVERLLPWVRSSLRGVVMNWKIHDANVVRGLPTWLRHLRGLGFTDVRSAALGHHRREIGVYAA